eukprot:NODE_200_length_2347_cov_31.591892_g194_i0.p2 GENE.NODE_200_length_2347_cov_31.591892_g194_i0~~NODE_200_length_2347_cov_31.591892_g194_i0.p2  ORF type:complete len:157 (-),score=0.98 NODE_200_length_2347_cov_31.591892_g194_i0:1366-1836(-)
MFVGMFVGKKFAHRVDTRKLTSQNHATHQTHEPCCTKGEAPLHILTIVQAHRPTGLLVQALPLFRFFVQLSPRSNTKSWFRLKSERGHRRGVGAKKTQRNHKQKNNRPQNPATKQGSMKPGKQGVTQKGASVNKLQTVATRCVKGVLGQHRAEVGR